MAVSNGDGIAIRRSDVRSLAAGAALTGVCALILIAPFEGRNPLVSIPGQSLSSVEAALIAALALCAASFAVARSLPAWRTTLTWPFLAFVAALAVAAAFSPIDRMNAAHMTGRMLLAGLVALMAANVDATPRALFRVYTTAAIAAAVVSGLVVLEYVAPAVARPLLSPFRFGTAVVGGQVRAAGPLQYPTIASMYLEIVFALTLPLFARAVGERRRVAIAAFAAVALLTSQAITLTLTRSGLLATIASVFVVAALHVRTHGADRTVAALVLVAAAIVAQFGTSRSIDLLRLRLTSETSGAWYRAAFDAPLEIRLGTGSRSVVPLTITNDGLSAWSSDGPEQYFLSYHWLLSDEDKVVSWEGLRTPFPEPVAPGDTVVMKALVEAPPVPGEYRLMWDIEQHQRLWFSTEPDADVRVTRATVSGAPTQPGFRPALLPLPRASARPGRLVLWGAALRMFAAHPATGVGPDNFRLVYGRFAGLARFDQRVHSNNMYLEVLAGAGLLGAAALCWLLWRAWRVFAALADAATRHASDAGLVAAAVAIALHGLFDSFLSFTATYLLIAIVLGLAAARHEHHRAHAHRF